MSVIGARESSNINDSDGEMKSTSDGIGRNPFSGNGAICGVNDGYGGASITLPHTEVGPLLGISGNRRLLVDEDSHDHARRPSNICEAEQALRDFNCSSKWDPSSSITRFDSLARLRKLATPPAGWEWVETILCRFNALGNLKVQGHYRESRHCGAAVTSASRSDTSPHTSTSTGGDSRAVVCANGRASKSVGSGSDGGPTSLFICKLLRNVIGSNGSITTHDSCIVIGSNGSITTVVIGSNGIITCSNQEVMWQITSSKFQHYYYKLLQYYYKLLRFLHHCYIITTQLLQILQITVINYRLMCYHGILTVSLLQFT